MFVSDVVEIASPLGRLRLGVVDPEAPGVAAGVSRLLNRSIEDAREESGGHLPSWLVDDIKQNYISVAKVRALWAPVGERFAVITDADEIIGTIHVARSPDIILTVDRHRINVPARDFPGFKPDGTHHVVNISVKHEVRRLKVGSLMVDGIVERFRARFAGDGLWVRADPPWHPGLVGLGFTHDPAMDVFLPAGAQRTAGLPHARFNARYACACPGAGDPARAARVREAKLQYVCMTRAFAARPSAIPRTTAPLAAADASFASDFGGRFHRAPRSVIRPRTIDELAAAFALGRRAVVRGAGYSYGGQALGDDLVILTAALDRVVEVTDDTIVVEGGVPVSRVVREALARGRLPPVTPSMVAMTIGGVLSGGGGLGRGSHARGLVADHVRGLVVVTGDGRTIACSPTQAAWLFEAALGGWGRFGAIAQVALALVPAPGARVRFATCEVGAGEVAAALAAAPDALHVSAVESAPGRFRVSHAFAGATGEVALADYLVAPPPERAPPSTLHQLAVPGDALPEALARVASIPHDVIHVHALATRSRALLAPAFTGFIVSLVSLVSLVTRDSPDGLGLFGRETLQVTLPPTPEGWRAYLGDDRFARFALARRLADPHGKLA